MSAFFTVPFLRTLSICIAWFVTLHLTQYQVSCVEFLTIDALMQHLAPISLDTLPQRDVWCCFEKRSLLCVRITLLKYIVRVNTEKILVSYWIRRFGVTCIYCRFGVWWRKQASLKRRYISVQIYGVTRQQTVELNFITVAVRTSNPVECRFLERNHDIVTAPVTDSTRKTDGMIKCSEELQIEREREIWGSRCVWRRVLWHTGQWIYKCSSFVPDGGQCPSAGPGHFSPKINTKQKAVWVPGPIWTTWRRETCLLSSSYRNKFAVHSLVTLTTELPRFR